MTMSTDLVSNWMAGVNQRLAAAGYTITQNEQADGYTFDVVARRSKFELTKFGFAENFFIFARFPSIDLPALRAFSGAAFKHGVRSGVISLPRGFFESVWVYPVAITPAVDEATLQAVRDTPPPKHWASAEIPVIHDLGRQQLHYFLKTPMWGAAYYKGFRKNIERILAGTA